MSESLNSPRTASLLHTLPYQIGERDHISFAIVCAEIDAVEIGVVRRNVNLCTFSYEPVFGNPAGRREHNAPQNADRAILRVELFWILKVVHEEIEKPRKDVIRERDDK